MAKGMNHKVLARYELARWLRRCCGRRVPPRFRRRSRIRLPSDCGKGIRLNTPKFRFTNAKLGASFQNAAARSRFIIGPANEIQRFSDREPAPRTIYSPSREIPIRFVSTPQNHATAKCPHSCSSAPGIQSRRTKSTCWVRGDSCIIQIYRLSPRVLLQVPETRW
jgi:hypothetical protein